MKKMIPMFLLFTFLLTGCAVSAPSAAPEANIYRQITMQEAVEMMEKEENYIIEELPQADDHNRDHNEHRHNGGIVVAHVHPQIACPRIDREQ